MRRFGSKFASGLASRCALACPLASAATAPAGASTTSSTSSAQKSFFKTTEMIGYVHSIDGTIATLIPAPGNPGVAYNTIIQIQVSPTTFAAGLVFNLEKDGRIGIILMDNITEVQSGQKVMATGQLLHIPVGAGVLGKVVNPLGHEVPVGLVTRSRRLLDSTLGKVDTGAPNIVSRSPVNYNLLTGFKAVDTMIPIGRGQRELIVGDRQTGKTSIAVSTIINQVRINQQILSKNAVISIYVSIGQRCSNVARIHRLLQSYGALRYTTVMAATAAEPAGLQYLAPYAGVTMGEYFMNRGRHCLCVYDDLSKQAVAYRQISLLLRRPPGREAYPGDVFYLHSRLLERAAMLSPGKGGGSVTALPIVETLSNDVTAYIVTNVISITDGQIYLDTKLFTGGQRPAVNIGLSVSRVGSSAQNAAMKGVAGKLKGILAEYRKLAADSVGGQQVQTIPMIRGARFVALFNQKQPSYFMNAIVSLYACLNGYLDDVKVQYVKFYEYLLVHRDLGIMYGTAKNKFFYMYVQELNYLIRFFTLNSPILHGELEEMLKQHTHLFLQHYQSKMNAIKSEKDVKALKNLLYSCKRAV
ncbi:ATP synthase alpha chain, mitochondrial precursor [Trypanosoma equiperdum]|uniref:ATP synthase subunit alpha, mitochondrial n=6 Tax=Trypanozoon TaxID=39700 RepID=ATPA_TRYBB|nr:ATP synthase alpha chain, mitochondrial precursor, putative [Trypanosoma brucei gambiense DAL972]XP_846362.1 ATP synthase alpha chain, mitochondrial precursor [Trypanosoma brucei brucei TREU927]XP_846363.1 ATP synthase alpha chain, mitochondrial precursor [Trypanosoma brucei brucei TREU927]Q9GS23.2 RecName: Full=ATP synthase subunit alpha, mitochondrial; AltName: Full=ATP synthase F1 subunit alpha; Flags: Precursor [Trypanosoma brucei brucei]8AP6_A1 Chain A1, ATP synthase subunit alpha, mito|eukprot:XP_011775303.1 ATP synthase alpha chain, mitochondrial precursor, putative [Trypanosoma brucei gambiense DAL972]